MVHYTYPIGILATSGSRIIGIVRCNPMLVWMERSAAVVGHSRLEETKMSEYAKRDAMNLGHHYIRHVVAMTVEGLHSKSDIAAELAYRDERIADLERWLADRIQESTELEALARDRGDEIEAMRPTFEQLKEISQVHIATCQCRACEMWRDYEARKPK